MAEKRPLFAWPGDPSKTLVPLGGKRGGFALIDSQYADVVGAHNWCAAKLGDTYYALTSVRKPDGRQTTLLLHRLVAQLADLANADTVDHKNHDTLDCRRDNLRAATQGENNKNTRPRKDSQTGFKGVSFDKRTGRFAASITLGTFDDAESAARAYDEAALRYFGEFAWLNFPRPSS